MNLPIIPQDKANHFIYGFAIYFSSMAFFALLNLLPVGAAFVALMDVVTWRFLPLCTVIFFAVAKEIYDRTGAGHSEVMDAVATVIPAAVITIVQLF